MPISSRRASLAALLALVSSSTGAASADTYSITTIATFNTSNGSYPTSGFIADPQGNLYSVTNAGPSGSGSIFEIAAGTHALSTVATLNGGGTGSTPVAPLMIDSAGNLYGTANGGGSAGDGTVFEVAASNHAVSTLVNFTGTANGSSPYGGLVMDSQGNLYGTTSGGGSSSDGTVFELAAGTHALSTLVTFTGAANGATPRASLTIDSAGNLYGTTSTGGSANDGTVFELAAGTHALTTLGTFTGGATGGANPYSTVIMDSHGNLFGTTLGGGPNGAGTVYEIAAGSHSITTIATFNGTNGASPNAGLTIDANGDLFGTTYQGGASSYGTAFEIVAGSNAITTIATFNGTNGRNLYGGLYLDAQGNLFGTTSGGGANNVGTAFELSPLVTAPLPASILMLAQGALACAGVAIVAGRRRRAGLC